MEAFPGSAASAAAEATTGSDGTYSLDLDEGSYRLVATPARADSQQLARSTRTVAVGSAPSTLDLQLQIGNVRGVVTWSDGASAAGVAVEAVDAQGTTTAETLSYSDGSYRLALGAGEYDVTAEPPAANPALDVTGTRHVSVPTDGAVVGDADLAFRQPDVRGRVLAPDGTTAVAGARVVVERNGSTVPGGSMRSRSDGTFGFWLPEGGYTLTVRPPGVNPDSWAERHDQVSVTAGDTSSSPIVRDLVLRAPTFRGVARNGAGDPVPEASVYVYSLASGQTETSTADDHGRFGVVVPTGNAMVFLYPPVRTPDLLDTQLTVNVDSSSYVRDLTFDEPNIVGRVVDGHGDPVPGATVNAYGPSGPSSHTSSVSFEDGRYSLLLPPGEHRLVAVPPDDVDATKGAVTVTVPDPATTRTGVDVQLGSIAPPPFQMVPVPVTIPGKPTPTTVLPAVSGDGSTVALRAEARVFDGVEGYQVTRALAVHDRDSGQTSLVRSPAGDLVDVQGAPLLSTDGSVVGLLSSDDGLTSGDDDGRTDVFLHRTGTAVFSRITRPAQDPEQLYVAPEISSEPGALTMSGDGRVVAFVVDHQDTDYNDVEDLLLVRTDADGVETGRTTVRGDATMLRRPVLSRDGSTLAWLQFDDGSGWNLHVRDLASGHEDDPRPVRAGAGPYDAPEAGASLSDDGSSLAYVAYHQVVGDAWSGFAGRARVADRSTGEDHVVDLFGSAGGPRERGVDQVLLGGDGRRLVTVALGPYPEDDDAQAWLTDLSTAETTLVSQDGRDRPGTRGVEQVAAAQDPTVIALQTRSQNLNGTGEDGVVLAVGGEQQAPTWPAGSALSADRADTGTTSVRLRWTAAEDNVGVTGYRVLRGTTQVGQTGASGRELLVTGLTPDTQYTFAVQAVDAAGNQSSDGPTLSVRTLPVDSTELRPLDASTTPGGTVHLAWEQATGADSLVVRQSIGGTVVSERTLAGDSTTFTESGLAASTTYTYQVRAVRGGTASDWTRAADVTTQDLAIGLVDFDAPSARGLARRGGTVGLTAVAEPGRTVQVEVAFHSWYDDQHQRLDAPAPRTALVPMVESAATPGSYTGGFVLTDGVARLDGVTGTVSDGHGATRQRAATRGGISVNGALSVVVDAPDGALPGGHVQATSAGTHLAWSRAIEGGGSQGVDGLLPGDDHVVRVLDGPGHVAAERTGVSVRNGLETTVSVTPRLPASLVVHVRGPGGAPVPGATVGVVSPDGSDWYGGGPVDGSGDLALGAQLSGTDLHVAVHPPADALVRDGSADLTLTPGANAATVSLEEVPRATVSGTATYADGGPVDSRTVTLVQRVGGRSHTFTGQTDDHGRYQVRGLPGDGHVSVQVGDAQASADLTLAVGDPVTADLRLEGPRAYDVTLKVFVQEPGAASEVGPVPLDWRTAVHYGLTLAVGDRAQPLWSIPASDSGVPTVPVSGFAGERVRLCLDGGEVKVTSGCGSVTLGADPTPTVELHAGPASTVRVRFLDDQGAPLAQQVTSRLYKLTDDGRRLVSSQVSVGSVDALATAGAGDYQLEAWTGTLRGAVTEHVPSAGETVEDDLALHQGAHFAADTGSVVPSRSEVAPGGDVDVRAEWRNSGSPVAGAVARILVPAGAQLLPGSVLLDGQSVPTTAGAGYADVDLGDVGFGRQGSLRYRLRVAADAPGRLPLSVAIRYDDAGAPGSEQLPGAAVRVAALSMDAPPRVEGTRLTVSGRAPAGAVVGIADGSGIVGQADAGPGGYWQAAVTLAEHLPTDPVHHLVASTVVGADTVTVSRDVQVDESRPVPSKVSIFQRDPGFGNGRRFTFDPREGVARFPFVFVPGQTTVLEVTFDQPDLVTAADVVVGSLRIPATRRDDGTWVATTTETRLAGSISVGYRANPRPLDLSGPGPSPEEVRAGVPALLDGFEVSDVAEPQGDPSAPRTGRWTTSLPALPGVSMRSSLTVTRASYAPTAADLARQQQTGVPAWDVHVDGDPNARTLSVSMAIPLSEVPGASPSAVAAVMARALGSAATGGSIAPRAAASVTVGVARVGFQLAFNGVTTFDSLLSALGAGDKYDKLSKAVDAAGGCAPGKIPGYVDRAKKIAWLAAASDVAGAALSIGSLVLGPETFGLGTLALGLLGWAMDKVTGAAIDSATDSLLADIAADSDCKKKEDPKDPDDPPQPPDDPDHPREPDRKVGDPTWIYDPSGYVFEGAQGHRLDGVSATLLTAPSENGPWSVWDADWFGQSNPVVTDTLGRYGWDVPEGWWKVAFAKDGYRSATSRVLRVLPPHVDVNVGMVADGLPAVTGAELTDGRVDLSFNRLVTVGSATQPGVLAVTDGEGHDVPGTWAPLKPADDPDGHALAEQFRFTPTTALSASQSVHVNVGSVTDYADRVSGAPYSTVLTVQPSAHPPGVPTGVGATAGDRRATVTWTPPADDGGATVSGYTVTASPGGRTVEVGAGATSAVVDNLTPGTAYTFTVRARNAVGDGSDSAGSPPVTPLALAPETSLLGGPAAGSFALTTSATFGWTSAPPGPSAVCRLDGVAIACNGGEVTVSRLAQRTHLLSVAARDADGDVDATPATRSWTVPRDDRALHHGPGWTRRTSRTAYLGTYSQATRRGAALSSRASGIRQVVLVATRGRGNGTVRVYLGARLLRTVSLSSSVTRTRQVLPVATFRRPTTGTVRVVVASSRKPVRVDGLGVSTAAP